MIPAPPIDPTPSMLLAPQAEQGAVNKTLTGWLCRHPQGVALSSPHYISSASMGLSVLTSWLFLIAEYPLIFLSLHISFKSFTCTIECCLRLPSSQHWQADYEPCRLSANAESQDRRPAALVKHWLSMPASKLYVVSYKRTTRL